MACYFGYFPGLIVSGVLFFAGVAQAQGTHTISDVMVDVTAEDGTAARSKALMEAEGKAFAQLLKQLLPAAEAEAKAARTAPDTISRMVRSYEVKEEKISARGYKATLDVVFDGTQVSHFLVAGGQPVATPDSYSPDGAYQQGAHASGPAAGTSDAPSPVLVLPVQRAGEQSLLWEQSNIWRGIWNGLEREGTEMVRLPIGDTSDKAVVTSDQVLTAGYAQLGALAERYQSQTVLVAEAVMGEDAGIPMLDVNLRSLGLGGGGNELTLSYTAQAGENPDKLMIRAARGYHQ